MLQSITRTRDFDLIEPPAVSENLIAAARAPFEDRPVQLETGGSALVAMRGGPWSLVWSCPLVGPTKTTIGSRRCVSPG